MALLRVSWYLRSLLFFNDIRSRLNIIVEKQRAPEKRWKDIHQFYIITALVRVKLFIDDKDVSLKLFQRNPTRGGFVLVLQRFVESS